MGTVRTQAQDAAFRACNACITRQAAGTYMPLLATNASQRNESLESVARPPLRALALLKFDREALQLA
jgi:hypothetical protein